MNRKLSLIIISMVLAVLFTGCAQKQPEKEAIQPLVTQPPAMQSTPEVVLPTYDTTLPDGYDPSSEEDPEALSANVPGGGAGFAQGAGATPIPLDPVDMPTPTPRSALTFTYAKYTADKLGFSFESVAGYDVDDSQSDTYILTEPLDQMKDNIQTVITLSVTPVNNSYKIGNLRSDLKAKLVEMGAVNYSKWETTNISSRTFINKEGYYGNYRGVLLDGRILRGRIHMALLDSKLFTINISYSGYYNTDYIGVYTHIRNTIKPL